jgi:hypothetical protein
MRGHLGSRRARGFTPRTLRPRDLAKTGTRGNTLPVLSCELPLETVADVGRMCATWALLSAGSMDSLVVASDRAGVLRISNGA